MFAKYLLLVLWIITLVQGDDDQHCDDTGCYPIVCDSDGCYANIPVVETVVETYSPSHVTSNTWITEPTKTITTCIHCENNDDVVTIEITSTSLSTIPTLVQSTTVTFTETSATTQTSCSDTCTKIPSTNKDVSVPTEISSDETSITSSSSSRSLVIRTRTTTIDETTTLPPVTTSITKTTTQSYTVIIFTDINSETTLTGDYTFIHTKKTRTVLNTDYVTTTIQGSIVTVTQTTTDIVTEIVVTCPDHDFATTLTGSATFVPPTTAPQPVETPTPEPSTTSEIPSITEDTTTSDEATSTTESSALPSSTISSIKSESYVPSATTSVLDTSITLETSSSSIEFSTSTQESSSIELLI
ncbi:Filamentous growth regulator 23 domain protein [Candida albicans]|uniref:Filamentous growth regulator 23 domain protein n=1 Tax=Candida albicans TaxID=5476 RepID=A0A8H6C632_CANAX|nr:Filamentous growth regulator 23 domain protein [Candida albicans]